MFINSKIIFANRLILTKNVCYKNGINLFGLPLNKHFHTTVVNDINSAVELLPIPSNIDVAESTRFSPHRARDLSATVISSQYSDDITPVTTIDITVDNSVASMSYRAFEQDRHVQSYDCFGAVSLNSAMQSNVPSPFGGMHKFSHLNMPGGQWSQECKFMSQNLQSSHFRALRNDTRSTWITYDQNASIADIKENTLKYWNTSVNTRCYCTKANVDDKKSASDTTANVKTTTLTKAEQLKRAFKEYGTTIVIFHITISLVSLGGFYLLVSGGIDMLPILDKLGLTSTALSNSVAKGASTFVVAYAIHKIFAPLRISITLGVAPFIVRYLRSKGLLKLPKT